MLLHRERLPRAFALRPFTWCLNAGRRFLLGNMKMTEVYTIEESSCKCSVAYSLEGGLRL